MRIFSMKAGKHAKRFDEEGGLIYAVYDWVGTLIIALVCVIMAFIFFFRIIGVVGSSMYPTLIGSKDDTGSGGDRMLVYTFMYKPKRGDIVVIDRYTDEPLIKRVIAVGGDTIQILADTNQVLLNHSVLEESYAVGITYPFNFGTEARTVPEGYLMVMGDNRSVSHDSRAKEIDFVSIKDVIGRAFFRFAPVGTMGLV